MVNLEEIFRFTITSGIHEDTLVEKGLKSNKGENLAIEWAAIAMIAGATYFRQNDIQSSLSEEETFELAIELRNHYKQKTITQ